MSVLFVIFNKEIKQFIIDSPIYISIIVQYYSTI